MKKWISILAILVLLSSCTSAVHPVSEEALPSAPEIPLAFAEPPSAAYTAIFLVDSSLDEQFYLGAQRFAKEVARLTGDDVTIEVRVVSDAGGQYKAGNGHLTFLDSKKDAALCKRFEAVTDSFLYTNYEIFTMAVNAQRTKNMIEEGFEASLPTVVIGAYYKPSRHFVSVWQPTNLLEFNQAQIAIDADSGAAEGFLLLGAGVAREPDVQERFSMLTQGYIQGAEFTLEELSQFTWNADEQDLYLTMSYHTTAPVWLVSSKDFYATLPPEYRAAVVEAAAYLYIIIDHAYLSKEAMLLEELTGKGILPNPEDLSAAREEMLRRARLAEEMDEKQPLDMWEAYMWDLLSDLE